MLIKAPDLKYKKFKNLRNYFDVIKFVSGSKNIEEMRIKTTKKRLVCTKRSSQSFVSAMPFIPSLTSLPSASIGNKRISINSKSSTDDILKELDKLKISFEAILEKTLESSKNIELIRSFLNGRGEVLHGIEIDPYIYMNGKRIENEGKYLNEILGKPSDKKMLLTFNLAVVSMDQSTENVININCSNCNQPCDACLRKFHENIPESPVKSKNIFSIFFNWIKNR